MRTIAAVFAALTFIFIVAAPANATDDPGPRDVGASIETGDSPRDVGAKIETGGGPRDVGAKIEGAGIRDVGAPLDPPKLKKGRR